MAKWADEERARDLRENPLPVYRVTAIHTITLDVAAHSPQAAKRIAESASRGYAESGVVRRSNVTTRVASVSLPAFGKFQEPPPKKHGAGQTRGTR